MEETAPSQRALEETPTVKNEDETVGERALERVQSEKMVESFKENLEHNRKLHFVPPKDQEPSGNDALRGHGGQQRYNHFMSERPAEGSGRYHWSK